MPNIITHSLFAKEVCNALDDTQLKQMIQVHPREFIIGSNGPDFLFFYKFFQKKHAAIRELGNQVHSGHVNEFYTLALQLIFKQQDEELKNAMRVYLAGHFCHWALDSCAHPYIFYKTGAYSGSSASMHHRFESMLDAMMLAKIRKETIKTFRFYLLAKQSPLSAKAVAALYCPIIREVFHGELSDRQVKEALDDWYRIQTYLYDPNGRKTKILKAYEKKVNHPFLYSGNVVPYEIDETFDIMNEKKDSWCYPTDENKTSNESFIEIFERAKGKAIQLLDHMDDLETILSILKNASYDTQESEKKEMKYFDLIYGGNHENL